MGQMMNARKIELLKIQGYLLQTCCKRKWMFPSLIWTKARATVSHPIYHTFVNTYIFFMRFTSKFFRLKAEDTNVNNTENSRSPIFHHKDIVSIKTEKFFFNSFNQSIIKYKNVVVTVMTYLKCRSYQQIFKWKIY